MVEKETKITLVAKKNNFKTNRDFVRLLKRVNKLDIYMQISDVAKLIKVNEKTIRDWEEAQLIFPTRNENNRRLFKTKDVLRAITIKFLMNAFGIRKLKGVELVLKLGNKIAHESYNEVDIENEIDNILVDQYFMKVLDYDVNAVAVMTVHGNNKRYKV